MGDESIKVYSDSKQALKFLYLHVTWSLILFRQKLTLAYLVTAHKPMWSWIICICISPYTVVTLETERIKGSNPWCLWWWWWWWFHHICIYIYILHELVFPIKVPNQVTL